jgi:hypothetical protein
VIALPVQTCGVVWSASGVERRVTTLDQAVLPVSTTSEAVARVEHKLDDLEELREK